MPDNIMPITKREDLTKTKINDFVAKGFHRLDPNIVSLAPPKIDWGDAYTSWGKEKKIEYLEKLANTMNHAAALIQHERNQLNDILTKKEAQLKSINGTLSQNNEMIQKEITTMNAMRRKFNARVSDLNKEIKELKRGSNN